MELWLVLGASVAVALAVEGVPHIASARRSRFDRRLAHISHELRGAVTGVQLALDAVQRRARDGDDVRRRVGAAMVQLERVTIAAEDLEAIWDRADRSRKRSSVSSADIGALIRRRADAWAYIAPPGRAVRVSWDPRLVVSCQAPARLCQALDNLVANAVEHGRGLVTVEGHMADGHLAIIVRDDGPGLPSVVARSAEGQNLRQQSRGHGLEIARRAVEICGGRLVTNGGGPPCIELPVPAHPALHPVAQGLNHRGALATAPAEARGPA
jgi:signal transduction histidine kinase